MAKGDIWVTDILNDSRLVVGTEIDRETPGWRALVEKREPTAEELPLEIYAKYKEQRSEDFKEIIFGAGGVKISSRMADIFRRFNLGSGRLTPAQLYLYDRKTPVDRDIFVIGRWEKREFLVLEESNAREPPRSRRAIAKGPPHYWLLPFEPKDGDIAIAPHGLNGLDFWGDLKLRDSLFMTDRLVQALKDAGYAKDFQFKKCKVIPLH